MNGNLLSCALSCARLKRTLPHTFLMERKYATRVHHCCSTRQVYPTKDTTASASCRPPYRDAPGLGGAIAKRNRHRTLSHLMVCSPPEEDSTNEPKVIAVIGHFGRKGGRGRPFATYARSDVASRAEDASCVKRIAGAVTKTASKTSSPPTMKGACVACSPTPVCYTGATRAWQPRLGML